MNHVSNTDPEVLLDRIGDLPALTPIVSSVLSLIRSEDSRAGQIGELIANDAALSTKILKVVNSAFYGLPRKVSTIQHAVVLLGFDTIKSLVVSTSVIEMMLHSSAAISDLKRLWERSLFAAVTARKIARLLEYENPEEAFMAGLMMDVGMLAQLKMNGEAYARIMADELHRGSDIVVDELQQFEVSHEKLGRAMLTRWGLPLQLSLPVLYHHDLAGSDEHPPEVRRLCQITHLARLASRIFYGAGMGIAINDYKKHCARTIEMSPDEVDEFFHTIREEVMDVSRQYGIEVKRLRSYTAILDAATAELTEINETYEQMNRELLQANRKAEALAKKLKQANEQLERMASVDELTELYNRRFFDDFIKREFERCSRYGRPMSCILIDIDHFKQVNDNHGHLQGDSILREVGALLASSTRRSDVAVRYGGEEFVIVLPETSLYSARIAAEKLRRAVDQFEFTHERGKPMHITISLGIACFNGGQTKESPEDLLARADAKLYESKAGGRNRISH